MRNRVLMVALAAVVGATLLGCSNRGGEPEVAFTVPGKGTTQPNCSPASVTPPAADQKPQAAAGTPPAPTALQTNDIKVGDGAEAKTGDKVSMEYVGVLFKDGTEFDSSWSRNAEPFEFTLGQGEVIKGWDQGIPGMKVGGQRQLIIPAELAYGASGSPPKIGPNEPLIFVVDLLQVCSSASAPASTTSLVVPTTPASTPDSTPATSTPATSTPASSTTATSTPASSTSATSTPPTSTPGSTP